MKVTATFESLEEFRQFMMHAYIISSGQKDTTEKKEDPETVPEIIPDPEEAQAEPKPEPKAEKPKKEEKKAIDYDAMRVECRKVLAELNKVTGKNTASEIIKNHGAEKLTGVEDEFLPELLKEAKEALQNAK